MMDFKTQTKSCLNSSMSTLVLKPKPRVPGGVGVSGTGTRHAGRKRGAGTRTDLADVILLLVAVGIENMRREVAAARLDLERLHQLRGEASERLEQAACCRDAAAATGRHAATAGIGPTAPHRRCTET